MNARATRAQVGARQPDLESVPNDFFVTHPKTVKALLRVERFSGVGREPACGDGTMVRVLEEADEVERVVASDLVDRASGLTGFFRHDFLTTTLAAPYRGIVHHVVTNPPFDLDEEFVERALSLNVPGKVAMFLRLAWLEGSKRYDRIYRTRPPARVWVFPKRQPLRRNGGEWQTGLIAFCWIVWEPRRENTETKLGWLPESLNLL